MEKMTSTIYDIDKIDIEKYDIIFNTSIDALKETLQTLCMNYYKSIADNDADAINQYLQDLNKYISLQIPSLNEYITYVMLIASNEILKKSIDTDIPLYNPLEMDLSFKTYQEKKAEEIIKQENLTDNDVQLIIENNFARMDIYCLQLSLDIDFNNLKPKPLPEHLQHSRLLAMNYAGDNEALLSAKLYFSMIARYGVEEK